MLDIYFYIWVGIFCIPLFICFIVSIFACRYAVKQSKSKKGKYAWIALISLLPAIALSAYKYFIIKEPLLLLAQFPQAFLLCFFTLWLFTLKLQMNMLLKVFIVLFEIGIVLNLIYHHVRESFIDSI